MKKQWHINQADTSTVDKISRIIGCLPITASVLVNRGIRTPEDAYSFINSSIEHIRQPEIMIDMDKAVKRISDAILNKEKILIFGDYDVDGVTSTVILHEFLSYSGANVIYHIPHRIEEGYGFQESHVDSVVTPENVNLIITVDCGCSSHDAINSANLKGVDTVVTDHHKVGADMPNAIAVVNPKRPDCPSGLDHLAGVGVAFYLLIALRKHMRESGFWENTREPNLKNMCDLVALGTIADIVPLKSENRILTKAGIDVINSGSRPGLQALCKVCSITPGKTSSDDIGFRLAPRLNAAGRMEHADISFTLLSEKDQTNAKTLSRSLDDLNRERQDAENSIITDIINRIEEDSCFSDKQSIVMASEDWHLGVVGIVASRLVNKYYKPVMLISAANGYGKGSGRSIPGVNLYDALNSCSENLEAFGGHDMAAGLKLKTQNFDLFCNDFENYIRGNICESKFQQTISIDSMVSFAQITPRLLDELEYLKPFGNENSEPLFASDNVTIVNSSIVGKKHRKMVLRQNGITMNAIQFNIDPELEPSGLIEKVAFKIQWNRWNGRKTPQLLVEEL